jgi:hypothetical protein
MLSPQEVVNKWATKMAAAGDAYKKGIMAVTENPMQKAAARVDAYVAGVQAKAQHWAARLMATPMATWQGNAVAKGPQRLTDGATAAKPKVLAHMTAFLPVAAALKAQVASMPKGGRANAQARFNAMLDAFDAFKQGKGGR